MRKTKGAKTRRDSRFVYLLLSYEL
jgi:hypothetical protein